MTGLFRVNKVSFVIDLFLLEKKLIKHCQNKKKVSARKLSTISYCKISCPSLRVKYAYFSSEFQHQYGYKKENVNFLCKF